MSPYNKSLQQLRPKRQFVILWPLVVGLLDICLGLLWMKNSATFLKVLGTASPDAWIIEGSGVIGIAVGLSYALALPASTRRWSTRVWIFTAVMHGLASVALIYWIDEELLPRIWWGGALMGLMVAVVQIATLRARWWSAVNKQDLKGRDWMPFEAPRSPRKDIVRLRD
ncbi:MAG: hypothetical protein WCP45_01235 [Verrucomicrobiota bacterium]